MIRSRARERALTCMQPRARFGSPLRLGLLALSLLALSAAGCARPVAVRATVMYPASVPIRAFPVIRVAGGALPEGDLGARLAQHLLKTGQHDVKRIDVKDLEPMRGTGAFPPYSLVVLLEPSIYDAQADGWQMQPVQRCDFWLGCSMQYQNVYGATPVLGGEVKLTVFEGPTARPLQTMTFEDSLPGDDSPAARKQLLDQLARKLERAVDVLQSWTRVELSPVDQHPIVREAIARIRKGEWDEGRSLLEQAAQQLGGLPHKIQARIWYDLAIARWYAPGPSGLTESAYQAALRPLRLAIQLDDTPRYERALERLNLARDRARVLAEQRQAATGNFALSRSAPSGARALTGATPAPR